MTKLLFAWCLLGWCLTTALGAAGGPQFPAEVRACRKKFAAVSEEANRVALAGETVRANQMLIAAAEKEDSPAGYFLIGNMLFKSDLETAYRFHAKALKALPSEPVVALEMAMDQHRKGEYEEAIANYRLYLAGDKNGRWSALLAECLLRTGRLREAVAAWQAADHARNHVEIDFAICEVNGPVSPVQRRGDLMVLAKGGDAGALTDLVLLDTHFDRDWWSSAAVTELVDADLRLAAKLLGERDPRYRHLVVYATLVRDGVSETEAIRRALAQARLVLGTSAVLPENPRLTRAVIELIRTANAETGAVLWQAHQTELRARMAKGDREALHTLCLLATNFGGNQLKSLTEIGWREWHSPEFAASYLFALHAENPVTLDHPVLVAALEAFPEDAILNDFRMNLAGESGITREMLVAAIKAEYRKLSMGQVIRDSYRLNGLFGLLRTTR